MYCSAIWMNTSIPVSEWGTPGGPTTDRTGNCTAGRGESRSAELAQQVRQGGEEGAEVIVVGQGDLDAAVLEAGDPALPFHDERHLEAFAIQGDLVGHLEQAVHDVLVNDSHGVIIARAGYAG